MSRTEQYWDMMKDEFPMTYPDNRVVSTDCGAIDWLLSGDRAKDKGISRGTLTGVFATKNRGKSWLAIQFACNFARLHDVELFPEIKKELGIDKSIGVIFVDAEGNWTKQVIELFYIYFRERWGLPKDYMFNIKWINKRNIYTLFPYFGMTPKIDQKGEKLTARVIFLKEGMESYEDKAGRRRTRKVEKLDHLYVSPVWRDMERYNMGALVLDSSSQPFKEVFPGSRSQDFPARSSLMNPFLGTLRSLAIARDIPVLVCHHLSMGGNIMFQSERKGSKPWGGADVMFHHKVMLGIFDPESADKTTYAGRQVRLVHRYRAPGLMATSELVELAKDIGFIDIIESGSEGS